jgi:hypothetical protein
MMVVLVIVFAPVLVGNGVCLISMVNISRKSVESDSQKIQVLLTDIRDRLGQEKKGKEQS